MRVAALSDIHGNLPALDAVLAEVDEEGVDAIVCGGDVAEGPWPAECLERLLARDARFVRGNADREPSDWCALQLSPQQRTLLAGLPTTLTLDVSVLGAVLFCHGSPRSDEEILTRLSSEQRVAEAVADVRETVIVSGHTHVQYDRDVAGHRLVNVGSVGMPYEGRPGAFWGLLGPDVELRHSEYDVEAAATQIEASGHPLAGDHARWLREPPSPEATSEYFEGLVGA